MLTRRAFCQLTAGAAAAPLGFAATAPARAATGPVVRQAAGQPDTYPITPVRDGAYALIGALGGNVLVLGSDDGAIVVDAGFAHTVGPLEATIRDRNGARTGMLINTHHHADHSGGNWRLGASVNTLAHRNFNPRIEDNLDRYREQARSWLSQLERGGADTATVSSAEQTFEKIAGLSAEDCQANLSVESDTALKHGGRVVELRHVGPGHTDNDLIVRFPEIDVIHAGDLIFNGLWPFIDRPAGATTTGWQRSLQAIVLLCGPGTIVVPGHGPLTDRDGVRAMSRFLGDVRDYVEARMAEGMSRGEIVALEPEPFANRGFDRLRERTLGAVYDELAGAEPAGGSA